MDIAIFAGAGFSVPFGFPVMNTFFDVLYDYADLSPNELQYVSALRKQCRQAGSMLEGTHNNLEHVLTFDSLNKSYDAGNEFNTSFASILSKVYTKPLTKEGLLSFKAAHTLFDTWNTKHNITFITTNYDIIIESAYATNNMTLFLPGDWVEEAISHDRTTHQLYSSTGSKSRHSICKLHGSINWETDSNHNAKLNKTQSKIIGSMVEIPIQNEDFHRPNSIIKYPELMAGVQHAPLNSLIVPPTYTKDYDAEIVEAQWKHAHKALSNAKEIHFIGYSFPSTDTHMRYFIASALASNEHLRKIHILNPDAESIYERLIDRRNGFGHEFEQMLTYESMGWLDKLPSKSRPRKIRSVQIA